jgi:hypothetical protein
LPSAGTIGTKVKAHPKCPIFLATDFTPRISSDVHKDLKNMDFHIFGAAGRYWNPPIAKAFIPICVRE